MMLIMKKYITKKNTGFFLLTFLAICFFYFIRIDKGYVFLSVHFLDVGQGDSILIQSPDGYDILIDGGPDARVLSELGKYMPFWDFKIDMVILTHPHSDHVGGLVDVLSTYDVDTVIMTGAVHTSGDYLKFLEMVRENNISVMIPSIHESRAISDDFSLEFLYPLENFSGKKVENLNNTSVVFRLRYGDTSFLFTGDAEKEVEAILVDKYENLQADVLKVGHHGSLTSSTELFLEKVKPKFAVISAGRDNKFGHPSSRILARFERIGARVFRTDLSGSVTLESDGVSVFEKSNMGFLDFSLVYGIFQESYSLIFHK